MNSELKNIIRLITTKGKSDFVNSLRENLDNRLHFKMAQKYASICENLYAPEKKQIEGESLSPIQEQLQVIEQKPINSLISSLQESIKDEKSIIHKFMNGESVIISHDDSKCLVNLHDSLNKINQQKMRKLMAENYSEYNKILQFSKKHTERTQK
jgi:hypothetical protein